MAYIVTELAPAEGFQIAVDDGTKTGLRLDAMPENAMGIAPSSDLRRALEAWAADIRAFIERTRPARE